jgi:N-acetylglucosamine-6-sulfatase
VARMLRPGLIASTAAIGLVATLTLQAVVSATCQVAVAPRQARPNIVVVVFDDLEVLLAEALPGWRGLEERGTTFTRAVVTSPLCCPSRVSTLTGKFAHNHGVLWNASPNGGHKRALEMGVESCTVAVWLQQAGYTTALMGKYLNGYGFETPASEIPAGWDEWAALWKGTSVVGGRYVLNVDGRLERPGRYQTDELAERAVRFMAGAERAGTPLFLYLAPAPPHKPWVPPARHASADAGSYELPDRYRTMLAGLDLVQRVIEAAPHNTYLIVTSDNGYHLHPTPGKAEPRWVDVNVPLVVLGPDVAVGARDELVANIDIAPTIADWAGITPPPGVDGSSFVPLIAGDPSDWRDEILTEMVGSWRAIVTRSEMRIHWANGGDDVIHLR